VLFDGKPILDDLMTFHQRVGYVPEEPHLYTHLSGMEYLVMVGQLRGMPSAPGLTYLLSGPEIASGNPTVRRPAAGTEHVLLTWKPRLRKRLSSAPK
jgi:hypothetical protein